MHGSWDLSDISGGAPRDGGQGPEEGYSFSLLRKSTEMGGSIDFAELTAVEKEQSQKGLFLAEYTL